MTAPSKSYRRAHRRHTDLELAARRLRMSWMALWYALCPWWLKGKGNSAK